MKEQLAQRDLGKYKNDRNYRPAFKLKVLDDLVSNQESNAFIARKHGIPHSTLITFKEELLNMLGYYRILEAMKKEQEPGDQHKDHEIAELKKALKFATMKVAALETLIDVAEDQFNVDIRKKAGSKQSK